MKSSKKISAIILAAGQSTRFGVDKMLVPVEGKPLIAKTIETFLSVPEIDEIIVTVSFDNSFEIVDILDEIDEDAEVTVVSGGSTRHESCIKALSFASGDYVLIHDGARPDVSVSLIQRVIERVDENTGVVPILNCTDSVVMTSGKKIEYINRKNIALVQTPQAFDRIKLTELYDELDKKTIEKATDNGEIWLKKYPLATVKGEITNKKITTPSDINRESVFSVGNGYDIHRLVENRKLVLGGVDIPHNKGLLGVSDADVVLHAVIDALLSAVGLPDIGNQFPENDPENKGIDSAILLEKTLRLVRKEGFVPYSIAITINAQKPKLAPYILSIRQQVAELCSLDVEQVGASATTGEGVGEVGREEAIACFATCLCRKFV